MWIESKGGIFDDDMKAIIEEVKKDVTLNHDNQQTS